MQRLFCFTTALVTRAIFLVLPALPLAAQAPTGLAAKSATSARVDLAWSGSAPTYSVQRRVLGTAYVTVATVNSTAWPDTQFDPYTTYQYQIVANYPAGPSTASPQITVGPPPVGVTTASLAPYPTGVATADYGLNLSTVFDGNGDPALTYYFQDPNQDTDNSDTVLLFRSWNRALYKWNDVVRLATVGANVANTYGVPLAIAWDKSSGAIAIATCTPAGTVDLYTSTDLGVTWTRKTNFNYGDGNEVRSVSLAMFNGTFHLVMNTLGGGLRYVTGQLASAASTWTTKTQPTFPKGGNAHSGTSASVALDSAGIPGIAYWVDYTGAANVTGVLLYWRPATTATPVKVMDNLDAFDFNSNVKLIYSGTSPRILTTSSKGVDYRLSVYTVKSPNNGATWDKEVRVPNEIGSSSDWPADIAVDSQGRGAVSFGVNYNALAEVCGFPRLARSSDFTSWNTCDVTGNLAATKDFNNLPTGLQVLYGANDRLYLLWNDGPGILMYREPPVQISSPGIDQVVNSATFAGGIVPGSWTSITGSNLSEVTRIWEGSDFSGNNLPLNLSGVSVRIGGLDAPVYYISPTQLNVQAPAGISGTASVVVTRNGVASQPFSIPVASSAPGLFTYTLGGKVFPAAQFANTTTLIGDPALYAPAMKAKPGDFVVLYGTGLASSPSGFIIPAPIPVTSPVTVTVGSTNVTASYAGLIGVGLFQINFTVPALPDGEYPIAIRIGSNSSQTGVILPMTH